MGAVSLTNGSFELPSHAAEDGYAGTVTTEGIPGWLFGGQFGAGIFNPTTAQFAGAGGSNLPAPAAGAQVVYVDANPPSPDPAGTYGFQNVGTIDPNTNYSLTVAVGARADFALGNFIILLRVDSETAGATLAQVDSAAPATSPHVPTAGTFADNSLSFRSDQIAPALADGTHSLFVVLINQSGGVHTQTMFDNVRLTTTPVPEPTGLALLGAAGAGALVRGRRRRNAI